MLHLYGSPNEGRPSGSSGIKGKWTGKRKEIGVPVWEQAFEDGRLLSNRRCAMRVLFPTKLIVVAMLLAPLPALAQGGGGGGSAGGGSAGGASAGGAASGCADVAG